VSFPRTGRTEPPDHRPLDGQGSARRAGGSGLETPSTNVSTGSNPLPAPSVNWGDVIAVVGDRR
jgi:hypothetical protein